MLNSLQQQWRHGEDPLFILLYEKETDLRIFHLWVPHPSVSTISLFFLFFFLFYFYFLFIRGMKE